MRLVVFDTNVYVDWMQAGLHHDLLHRPDDVRYLSAMVLAELRAGATTRRAHRALDGFRDSFVAHHRCLSPSSGDLDRAGRLLQRLRKLGTDTRRAAVLGDVLIAVAARSVGAWVITRDAGFASLRRVLDFRLVIIGSAAD